MQLTLNKNSNINYVCQIVNIEQDQFKPHPNADKLQLVEVNGCTVTVGINEAPGVYLYFPTECKINPNFLSFHNLFRDSKRNLDTDQKGFFEDSGRVKCLKLREVISEGLVLPLSKLEEYLEYSNIEIPEKYPSIFDTINNEIFVSKYTLEIKTKGANYNESRKIEKSFNDHIIENQFVFHIDTPKLKDNLFKLNSDDLISITEKLHGTSVILCNLLVHKKLNWFEKILNAFKVPIISSEYMAFCSSRRVIKSPILNKSLSSGYYDVDIWNIALDVVKPYMAKGETLYAEIVGYLPNGSQIQKDYPYDCIYDPKKYDYAKMDAIEMYKAKLFNIYIYRITSTNIDGNIVEYSAKQVQQWCNSKGLNAVPELYYGYSKDLYNIKTEDDKVWKSEFLENLKLSYLEGPDKWNPKVPAEGIVLRKEILGLEVFKLKSVKFLQKETLALDKGEVDIESEEAEYTES